MNFKPIVSDSCVFVRGSNILILYVDDCIIISQSEGEAKGIYNELQNHGFKITDEGTMETYLGIRLDHYSDGSFKMSQPYLIDRIIESIPGMKDAKIAKTPAAVDVILTKDPLGKERTDNWNYRSVIGQLNYLVNCTHPDLSYAVHQCARFSNDPKYIHEQAVKRIIRYLLYLKRKGMLGTKFYPDTLNEVVIGC